MLDSVYLDGEFMARDQASLPLNDLAILRAYAIFDYFRYKGGKLQFFDDHWARFERSAAQLDLRIGLGRKAGRSTVEELVSRNGGGDGGVRLVLTGGSAHDGYTPTRPRLMAMAYPHRQPNERLYQQGVGVLIHAYERQLPTIKSTDYLEGIRIQPSLRAGGYDFPLYLDRAGKLRESDRSNFMIVRNDTLITPIDNILLGITRMHALRLAVQLGIPIEERTVSLEDFLTADEALLTSSNKGVMPITRSDRGKIANGHPGPITQKLMNNWTGYCQAQLA